MAKRFIDTALFDDEWFMELSKEGKLFWIYAMTKCDHAGILQLNEKLCKFQTGIKNIETVKEELGNRIITLRHLGLHGLTISSTAKNRTLSHTKATTPKKSNSTSS